MFMPETNKISESKVYGYQNFVYNAVMIRSVRIISTKCDGLILNMLLSISNAFGFTFGPAKLITIITTMVKKNDRPMQMRNGISNPPSPFG
jgi:hypothetical protein